MNRIYFSNQRGVLLVGTVALLIFLGLFAAVGASIVTSSAAGHNNLIQGAQALAIAHAGAEWYLQQLAGDNNWANEVNQTKSFAEGSFTIAVSSPTATQVTFTSTGSVTASLSNVTVQRNVSMTAQKLSPAFLFALYQGNDPGVNLTLATGASSTAVNGDMWSAASVTINSPNAVTNGKVYVPDTKTVTGTGTYTSKLVSSPYLSMPVITTTYYTNLIAGYNTALDADNVNTDRTVNNATFDIDADAACTGNPKVCNFRNFTTKASATVKGSGTIVANQTMKLHDGEPSGSTLTITPTAITGGTITFLANRDLLIGDNKDPVVNVASGCTFYSRSATATGQRLSIDGANTALNAATLIANRRIVVQTGAGVINDSTLFVNYPGDNTNNFIDIIGDAAVTAVDGTMISISRNDPGLRIRNSGTAKANTSVTGLVYAYGSAATGFCDLDDSTISGSVVCNRYSGNQIANTSITYNLTSLPATPPQGFETFVIKKQNSWDGL